MDEQALLGMGDGSSGGGDSGPSPAQVLLGGGGGSQYSPTMTPTAEPVPGNAPSSPQPSFPSWSAPQPAQGGDMGAVGGQGQWQIPDVSNFDRTGAVYTDPSSLSTSYSQNSGLYPAIFSDKAPATGWFTMDDYWRNTGSAPPASGKWQANSGALSNNMPDPNNPDLFMFNGELISRSGIRQALDRETDVPPFTGYGRGDPYGYPIAFSMPGWAGGESWIGYPGSLAGYHRLAGGTT